jgi:hypothetical protein
MHFITRAVLAVLAASIPLAAVGAEKTFDLPAFTGIEISSGLDALVTVTPGATQSVVVTSPRQEEIDELKVEVNGSTLKAYTDFNLFDIFDFAQGDRQTLITITVPALQSANANSGSDIDLTGISGDTITLHSSSGSDLDVKGAAGKSYDIDSSSGSQLTIEGTCESARINASSGSNVRADKLLCLSIDANASSGSDADVYASESVKADASSGSDLTVHGNPAQTEINSSSGADVHMN